MTDVVRMRQAWQRGEPAYGAFLFTRLDPVMVEMLSGSGYDYVCLDLQHGMMMLGDAVSFLQAVALGPASSIVRVQATDRAQIGRVLDAGAGGVIVPMIESGDQAREAVLACRYAPQGKRSFGPIPASVRYGSDYAATANQRVLCIPMIETREGVQAAEEICATPGVDAIYVGPSDLALSYGLEPSPDSLPGLQEPIRRILAACAEHDVVPAVHAHAGIAGSLRDMGFRMITVADDVAVLGQGFARALDVARGGAGEVAEGGGY